MRDNRENWHKEAFELDLTVLPGVLKKRAWLIALCSAAGLLAAYFLSVFVIEPRYASSVSLYVNNSSGAVGAVNINDLAASQKLVNTYIVILRDDEVLGRLGERLLEEYDTESLKYYLPVLHTEQGPRVDAEELRDRLSMTAVNGTEVLRIEAETKSAELSARICTILTEIAPEVLTRVVKAGSVEVIGSARLAEEPASPNIPLNCAVGFGAGLLLSSVLAVLLHTLDGAVKDGEDLKKRLGVPVLGRIPEFRSADGIRLPEPAPFAVAEAYKALRTNILFALAAGENKAVAVSSPTPADGKSATCLNLAAAMARTGAKVALVDADLRKPALHLALGADNKTGLSGILAGLVTMEEATLKDAEPNLDFIPSGPAPPNPSELLGSRRAALLLETLNAGYDYIFIDTPPVNIVTDAFVLANAAAGAVLVARRGRTRYEELDGAVLAAELSGTKILGTVLNAARDNSRKYTGYPGLERSGLERSGLERSGLERSGLERSGAEGSGGL